MNQSNLNYDIYTFLLKFIDSPKDLSNYCSLNTYFFNLCKDNKTFICKHFLHKYQVNYENQNDFIFITNKVNQKDYLINDKWNYPSLFKLYMKHFYKEEIECNNRGITSFPIYPNMKKFDGRNNQLTSFPIQPEMIDFNVIRT